MRDVRLPLDPFPAGPDRWAPGPPLRGVLLVWAAFCVLLGWSAGAAARQASSDPGDAQALAAARAVLENDARAALVLVHPLIADGTAPRSTRVQGFALAAEALDRLHLPVLSLLHWQRVLESGDVAWQNRAFHEASRLSRVVHNDDPLLVGMRRLDPAVLEDPADRAHGFYLRGVALDADDRLSDAVGALAAVPETAQDYVRARLLMAAVLTRMRQRAVAVATLEDLRLEARDRLEAEPALQELVQLNLARSLYGAGRVAEAIDIYQAFPRRSPAWLEAQSELAWAWYRTFMEQEDWAALNRAIGTVHTLTSPFFQDRYLPEPDLLAAQFLYHLCRFVAGGRVLEAFFQKYTAVRDRLRDALNTECRTPGATLRLVLAWRAYARGEAARPETRIPSMVLQLEEGRPSLAELERHLAVLAAEWDTLEAQMGSGGGEPFVRLSSLLREHEGAVRQAYDRSLRAELRRTLWDLNQRLRQGRMLQLSMTSALKNLYEAAAAGQVPREPPSRRRHRHRWPTADRHVWPFEGEYWADELGYYQAQAVPLCPP